MLRRMLAVVFAAALLQTTYAGFEAKWTSRVDSVAVSGMTPYAQPVTKSRRHCSYLCAADSTCKSMHYDKNSTVCSLFTDDAPNLIPDDSRDAVAFTSPSVSPNLVSWYTVLRSTAGSGVSVYDTWMSTEGYNADQGELASRQSTPAGLYKSALIDSMWASVQRVKVSVYSAGVEQFFMEYDASGSDKLSWFAANRLLSGSVTSPATEYHTVEPGVCVRRFYIVSHGGCAGDWGHLMVTDVANDKPGCCAWDNEANPRFLFATTSGATTAAGMTAGEVFLIQVLL